MLIDANSIAREIMGDIREIAEQEEKELEALVEEMATDCHNTIRRTAPKKSGKYARSWKMKREDTHTGPAYIVKTENTGGSRGNPYAGMADWFEHGTADRVTKFGASRGRMKTKQAHIRKAFEQAVRKHDIKEG